MPVPITATRFRSLLVRCIGRSYLVTGGALTKIWQRKGNKLIERMARPSGSLLTSDLIGPTGRLLSYASRTDRAARLFRQILDGAPLARIQRGQAVCQEGRADRHAD